MPVKFYSRPTALQPLPQSRQQKKHLENGIKPQSQTAPDQLVFSGSGQHHHGSNDQASITASAEPQTTESNRSAFASEHGIKRTSTAPKNQLHYASEAQPLPESMQAQRKVLSQIIHDLLKGKITEITPETLTEIQKGIASPDKTMKITSLKMLSEAIHQNLIKQLTLPSQILIQLQTLFPDPEVQAVAIQMTTKALKNHLFNALPDSLYEVIRQAQFSNDPVVRTAAKNFFRTAYLQSRETIGPTQPEGILGPPLSHEKAHAATNLTQATQSAANTPNPNTVSQDFQGLILHDNATTLRESLQTLGMAIQYRLIPPISSTIQEELFRHVFSTDPLIKSAAIKTLGQAYKRKMMKSLNRSPRLNQLRAELERSMHAMDSEVRKFAVFTHHMIAKRNNHLIFDEPNFTLRLKNKPAPFLYHSS